MGVGGEDEIQSVFQEEAQNGDFGEDAENYTVFAGGAEGQEEDGDGEDGVEEEALRMDAGEAEYGRGEYYAEEDGLRGGGGQKGKWGQPHDQGLASDFCGVAGDVYGEEMWENCGGPEAIGEDEGACAIIDEAQVFKSDTSKVSRRGKCSPTDAMLLESASHTRFHSFRPSQGVPLMDRVMVEALEKVEELRKGSCLLFNHGVYKCDPAQYHPSRRGNHAKPNNPKKIPTHPCFSLGSAAAKQKKRCQLPRDANRVSSSRP